MCSVRASGNKSARICTPEFSSASHLNSSSNSKFSNVWLVQRKLLPVPETDSPVSTPSATVYLALPLCSDQPSRFLPLNKSTQPSCARNGAAARVRHERVRENSWRAFIGCVCLTYYFAMRLRNNPISPCQPPTNVLVAAPKPDGRDAAWCQSADRIIAIIDAVRNGTPPNCPAEEGHKSVALLHLGNIAWRVVRELHCDPANGHILKDRDDMKLWRRKYESGWNPKFESPSAPHFYKINSTMKKILLLAAATLLVIGAKAQTPNATSSADKLGWQLAIHSYTFRKFPIAEAIDKTAAMGVHYMSISGSVNLVSTNSVGTMTLSEKDQQDLP